MDFRIDVHHFFELPSRVEGKLDRILEQLDALEATVTPELQRLQQSVAEERTVVQSAITTLAGLADQIRALKDDPAALAALADSIDADKQALADAIVANTTPPPTP